MLVVLQHSRDLRWRCQRNLRSPCDSCIFWHLLPAHWAREYWRCGPTTRRAGVRAPKRNGTLSSGRASDRFKDGKITRRGDASVAGEGAATSHRWDGPTGEGEAAPRGQHYARASQDQRLTREASSAAKGRCPELRDRRVKRENAALETVVRGTPAAAASGLQPRRRPPPCESSARRAALDTAACRSAWTKIGRGRRLGPCATARLRRRAAAIKKCPNCRATITTRTTIANSSRA